MFCLCAAFATLLCIASQTIPDTFAALFTQDDSLVPLAASCIRKYAVGLLGVAVQYAFVDGLTAMGQMRAALPISFFRKGLYVLCVLVLPHLRPIQNVFWSAGHLRPSGRLRHPVGLWTGHRAAAETGDGDGDRMKKALPKREALLL